MGFRKQPQNVGVSKKKSLILFAFREIVETQFLIPPPRCHLPLYAVEISVEGKVITIDCFWVCDFKQGSLISK